MSICYADQKLEQLPIESRLLDEVVVRLIEDGAERRRHDELLEREHYLHNATAVTGSCATSPNTGRSGSRC